MRRYRVAMGSTRPVMVVLAIQVAAASPAAAQPTPPDLQPDADVFAAAWQAGNVARVAGLFLESGIRLQLPDATHPSLSVRQATATVESVHRDAGRGPVRVIQLRVFGGDPARGFVELVWSPLPSGTGEPLSYTVYAGFEMGPEGWRLYDLRVLNGPQRMDSDGESWR